MEKQESYPLVRLRLFYEVTSPYFVTITEEKIYYNNGEDLDGVIINSDFFYPHLFIFDSNMTQLQYHSEIKDYNPSITPDHYSIIIDFYEKWERETFKTIYFKYNQQISPSDDGFTFQVPFDKSQHTYVYIKKLNQFLTNIELLIEDREKNKLLKTEDHESGEYSEKSQKLKKETFFKLGELEEANIVISEDRDYYYSVKSTTAIPNCNFIFTLSYRLDFWNRLWYNFGIVFAFGSMIAMYQIIRHGIPNSLPIIVAIGGIAISYLIIIKGWLFSKDLDEAITIEFMDLKIPKITYSGVYIMLIISIFLELLLLIKPFS